MTEILEMFSSLLGDFDFSQITELFNTLVDYITNLLASFQ